MELIKIRLLNNALHGLTELREYIRGFSTDDDIDWQTDRIDVAINEITRLKEGLMCQLEK